MRSGGEKPKQWNCARIDEGPAQRAAARQEDDDSGLFAAPDSIHEETKLLQDASCDSAGQFLTEITVEREEIADLDVLEVDERIADV